MSDNLSFQQKVNGYKIFLFLYFIMAFISIYYIKKDTFADYSGGIFNLYESSNSAESGIRLSIWFWIVGLLITIVGFLFDYKKFSTEGNFIGPYLFIIYYIFHILFTYGTKLVDIDFNPDISYLNKEHSFEKWFQIIMNLLFIWISLLLLKDTKKANNS
jgi:hypothetical protein